jgi:hypothetical protein
MGSYYAGSGGGLDEAAVQAIADAAEDAAAAYTDTAMAAAAAADPDAIAFRSTVLYPISPQAGLTTVIPANRRLNLLSFRPAKACTLSKVGVNVTIVGEAGCTIRLCIAEDSDGLPADVLWQSSVTLDGAVGTGEKSQDPDLAIVPTKLYWAGCVAQAAVTTRPTFSASQNFGYGRTYTTTFAATGRVGLGYDLANDSTITDPLVAANFTPTSSQPFIWLQAD